eukprot:s3234_g5.t3
MSIQIGWSGEAKSLVGLLSKVLVEEHLACRVAVVQADRQLSCLNFPAISIPKSSHHPTSFFAMALKTRRVHLVLLVPLMLTLSWTRNFLSSWGPSMDDTRGTRRREMLAGAVLPALMPEASNAQVPDWQGAYEDPDHPGCKREVRVEGMKVTIDAAEGKPGCGNGEKEISFSQNARPWSVSGKLSLAAYNEMILDMRPRGGPERLIATWESNGIRFPEGNFAGKWIKKATLP